MEIAYPVMQFDRNITDGRVMRRVAKLHGDPAIESSPTGCTAITPLRAVRRCCTAKAGGGLTELHGALAVGSGSCVEGRLRLCGVVGRQLRAVRRCPCEIAGA
eukprot:7142782-Lingulodinium_polyedra.AAC.1